MGEEKVETGRRELANSALKDKCVVESWCAWGVAVFMCVFVRVRQW